MQSFDFDMSLQAAVEATRWQSESTGCVELERRFADAKQFLDREWLRS